MTRAGGDAPRRKIAAGNWKMNGLLNASDMLAELQGELRNAMKTATPEPNCDIIICPPFPYIHPFGQILGQKPPQILLGGQDCHPQETGAHTGDISAEMLADIGVKFVIIGHSERRANHGETDAIIAQKTHAAWRAGLCAIVCVGETLAERAEAQTVVARQLQTSLPDGATPANLVVAYEPIWAIGTGHTPNDDDIAQMHGFIRAALAERFGALVAGGIRVLYGGSMNAGNAGRIAHLPDVDGGLIGGASLKAADFAGIIFAMSG